MKINKNKINNKLEKNLKNNLHNEKKAIKKERFNS